MAAKVLSRHVVRDAFYIVVGSFIFALGIDCFAVPAGLAAGGVTGLATVIYYIGLDHGVTLPVGTQTLVMNAFLMIPVIRSGGLRYAAKTVAGIVISSVFMDLLAPVVPALGGDDLLLCALWGGVLIGVGLGIVFKSGGNTGGVDIIAQLLSKPLQIPIGTLSIVIDFLVVLVSVPVLSLENALYATIMMALSGKIIDMVIDGPRTERAAWIISSKHDEIANLIMYEMGRGCREVAARGVWSGEKRPMLLVILGRREISHLKSIVADVDKEALVVISDVHEVFGEGFRDIGSSDAA
jgi:uncharacterized membrane-anchored protein YitT (DUF2179 family)